MLVYFPTVALIERLYQYSSTKDLNQYISRYHGQMKSYEKEENYQRFLNNETPVMLATKAFGMGIDIDDIEIVVHFSQLVMCVIMCKKSVGQQESHV